VDSRLYADKVSGSLDSRPEFDKLMDALRAGDVVVSASWTGWDSRRRR